MLSRSLNLLFPLIVCMAAALNAGENLIKDWKDGNFTATVKKSRGYTIPVKPEWRGLRLRCAMRPNGVTRGKENWCTGRLTITFHDAKGKLSSRKYPLQHECLGTGGWKTIDHEYLIPSNTAAIRVGFCNLGVSGSVEFRPPTLEVTRGWITKPCNAPLPAGRTPADESFDVSSALRSRTRAEMPMDGLWRCRPAFTDDPPDSVPAQNDCWGWSDLPSCWTSGGDFPATGVLSPYFADNSERLSRIAPMRAWYAREIVFPESAKGLRASIFFSMLNTRAVAYVDGRRAGEANFPCGEVDITEFVRPGERQSIAIDVTAWPRNAETLSYNAPDRATMVKSKVVNKGLTGRMLLKFTPRARIVGAYVDCDTAAEKATFTAETDGFEPGEYKVSASVEGPDGERREFSSRAEMSKGGVLRFAAGWSGAKRWDVHTPGNLYKCRVSVADASGRVLDETVPFTFGFRDVKVRGRDLLLNGIPIHLRALHNNTMNGAASAYDREAAREMCRRVKSEGFNFIIAGNYNFREGSVAWMDPLLEACD